MCHTVGGGRLVGPDLSGVHQRRAEKWLVSFIQSSQAFINKGDPEAKKIFEEFNKIIMPDQDLSDDQVKAVIAYITASSPKKSVQEKEEVEVKEEKTIKKATKEDVELGQQMFQGLVRFKNKGPSCISCHDVKNDAVIGGGVLARELTSVFGRLGGNGVRAVLSKIPFPVMQRAYLDKALTDREVFALTSFLEHADKEQFYQVPRDYGMRLFYTGIFGALFLFVLFAFLWRGRKKRSVNQDIYDRQVKSEISSEWDD
jgi:mono/diheme cytochrome c family protein